MTPYPFFSVIIPTHNRAALIPTTLDTVFRQTYPHYEIIVVDDCSTDNTAEVLAPCISSGQVRYLRNERNSERAYSRNVGLNAANGDFVTFLDSDDLMYQSNLADAAAYARAHPDIKCFHNLAELLDERGQLIERFGAPPSKDQIRNIARGNFMGCIGDFIHRDIYQKYDFDTNSALLGTEDWEYWLRVLADHPVGRIEKINSGVVQHRERSMSTVSARNLQVREDGCAQMIEKFAADSHLSKVYGPHLKRLQAAMFIELAGLANGMSSYQSARRYLAQATRHDPRIMASTIYWRVAVHSLLKGKHQRLFRRVLRGTASSQASAWVKSS